MIVVFHFGSLLLDLYQIIHVLNFHWELCPLFGWAVGIAAPRKLSGAHAIGSRGSVSTLIWTIYSFQIVALTL